MTRLGFKPSPVVPDRQSGDETKHYTRTMASACDFLSVDCSLTESSQI